MSDFDMQDLEGPKIDRRKAIKLLAATGFTGSLAGCPTGGDGSNGNGVGDGNTVEVISHYPIIDYLDPGRMRANAMGVARNVFSSLVQLDPNANIVGDLATDWSIPDDTTMQFDLHSGVTFHNGETLNAESIKWSFERLIGRDDFRNQGNLEPIDSIEAPDDTTLIINLNSPDAPFMVQLTDMPGRSGMVVSRQAVEEMGDEEYNQEPIGSGPYEIVEHESGESLTLQRFDDYWKTDENDEQLPHLDEIQVSFIQEGTTRWNAMRDEQAHLATSLPPAQVEGVDSIPHLRIRPEVNATHFIAFLCNDPQEVPDLVMNVNAFGGGPSSRDEITEKWQDQDLPTSDKRVRQALSKAIDRERIHQVAMNGRSVPAYSILPPTVGETFYVEQPENYQDYDPDEARSLLDEAGYTGEPRFSAEVLSLPEHERFMTMVEEMWADIGVEIDITIRDRGTFFDTTVTHEYMIYSMTNSGIIDPWDAWWQQLYTPGEGNRGNWQGGLYTNPEFDELLEESRRTLDSEAREEIVREAEQIYLEDLPYANIHFVEDQVGVHSSLQNLNTVLNTPGLERAYLE